MKRSKFKKGDEVQVIAGKEKGKVGKIVKLIPEKERAVVQGVNFVKKHRRPTRENPQGGIDSIEASIHVSNLMVVCPEAKKPTRVGIKKLDSGEQVRFSKRSGYILDN